MLRALTRTAIVMSTLTACSSSASLVRTDPIGGRVQLAGAYMPAMADARMLMAEQCHGRFEVAEHRNTLEFRCTSHPARPQGAEELALHAMDATR